MEPSPRFISALRGLLSRGGSQQESHHWRSFNDIKRSLSWDDLRAFRSGQTSGRLSRGLDDPASRRRTQLVVDHCWETPALGRRIDLLLEPSDAAVGRPPYSQCELPDGSTREINYNDIMLAYIAVRVAKMCELTDLSPRHILEIGGGYGGLAHKLALTYPAATFTVIDLPEALALQAYFLASHHGEERLALHYADARTHESGDARFHLVCAGTRPMRQHFDLVINTRSFMEMTRAQLQQYFALIQSTMPPGGLLYNLNRYLKTSNGSRNAIGRYPYDSHWRIVSVMPSVLQPQLLELVTARSSIANKYFQPFLRTIPRNNHWWQPSLRNVIDSRVPYVDRWFYRDVPRLLSRLRRRG